MMNLNIKYRAHSIQNFKILKKVEQKRNGNRNDFFKMEFSKNVIISHIYICFFFVKERNPKLSTRHFARRCSSRLLKGQNKKLEQFYCHTDTDSQISS